MKTNNLLKDGFIYGAVYLILLLVALFIPVLSLFITFVLPIPFMIYAYKYDVKPSIIMVVATILISLFFATVYSLPLTILMSLGGTAIGLGLRANRNAFISLAWGTLGYSIGLAIVYVLSQLLFDINWNEQFREAINQSLQTYISSLEQIGQTINEETMEALELQMNSLLFKVPTGLVMSGLFFAWVTQWIGQKIINRIEGTTLKFPPFREFTLPTALIWYYLIGLILTLIYSSPNDSMFLVAENLYTLAGLLLALQGLSFIFFFAHHKKWPRFIPYIAIVLLIFQPILFLYPLRILGIIDLGLQLRDRLSKK